jgi:hypothetical protein
MQNSVTQYLQLPLTLSKNKETIMSQSFQVTYTAYRGQGSEVLAEGTVVVSAGSRMQAEDTVKAQFGFDNRVIIHSVFSA